MLDAPSIAAVAVTAAALFLIHAKLKSRQSSLSLPPGPPPHWLWGNHIPAALYAFSFSSLFVPFTSFSFLRSAYRKFEEWTQEYGALFSLRQGFNTTIIVIGRLQAAIDIMEKEGAVTVDRPVSISAGETLSGGMRVLLTPAGERFKKMRR